MGSVWPLLLTLLLTIAVLRMALFRSLQPLPAGDLLVIMERSLRLLRRTDESLGGIRDAFNEVREYCRIWLRRMVAVAMERIKQIENYIARWEVAVFFVVLLLLTTGLISLIS